MSRLEMLKGLDPVTDFHEIYRATVTLEFPWDMKQALSFALFRTYAVPSIGNLLARTGEFTRRTQKRYDDTALILDAVLEHGFGTPEARVAFRRMNQMHGSYPISNDDMRYVLSTFVVTPVRWLAAYGWRPMSEAEIAASVTYYRAVAGHMGIRDVPETYAGFEALMDGYERDHFAFSPGGRAVADATLGLLSSFPPFRLLPARLARPVAYTLMDDPLLRAFRFPRPNPVLRAAVRAGLAARARAGRWQRPLPEPRYARQSSAVRSYPEGYDLSTLGTFPGGRDGDQSASRDDPSNTERSVAASPSRRAPRAS
jgi:hypothetical protein